MNAANETSARRGAPSLQALQALSAGRLDLAAPASMLGVPRAALRERFRHPFLLQIGASDEATSRVAASATVTTVGGPAPPRAIPGATAPRPKLAIYEVKKRGASNPFAGMVTLGRAANNDIVLADPSISAFHACFAETRPGRWTLTDSSKNGTWASERRLAPREPLELFTGTVLRFAGSFVASFVGPDELLDLLDAPWEIATT